jgi:molecular chaperone DnaK
MSVRGENLQVLATGGDTFLGGEDFDQAIVDHVAARFEAETGQRLSQNLRARAVVKEAAEKAKRRLSVHDRAMVTVREVMLLKGGTSRLEVELDRETVEKLVEPLVARTLRIVGVTLVAGGVRPSDLDDVLLVGGQTRMPHVRKRVGQELGLEPRSDLDPDEVVALGAGMLADIARNKAIAFSDVLSMTIGVDVGGVFRPLLPRNTQLPCSKSFEVSVPQEKLSGWEVQVYQGDNEKLHANEHLGTLRVDAVDPGPEDPVRLRIDVELSADCLLQFTITNVATGESQAVVLLTSDL